ncbi:hypothetical protein E2562_014302 [Oryza meyeriana var. granulata]|uniref:Uncharacterized protein n=1 Tax=Oryza meyeriana var. granulata TaxID=110450 RepID=A0A6G1C7W8_9ORYZ|nr:hypothetical protein E2562_014302 [Oryza meyeriana var. granulata]
MRISAGTHRLTGKGTSPPIQAVPCGRPEADVGGSSGGQGGRRRMAEGLASKLAFVMRRAAASPRWCFRSSRYNPSPTPDLSRSSGGGDLGGGPRDLLLPQIASPTKRVVRRRDSVQLVVDQARPPRPPPPVIPPAIAPSAPASSYVSMRAMAARIPTISLPPDLGGSLIVIDIGGLACLDPLHIQFFAPAVLIRLYPSQERQDELVVGETKPRIELLSDKEKGIQVQLDLKSNGKGSNAKKAPAGRSRASVSAAGGRLLAGQVGRGRGNGRQLVCDEFTLDGWIIH